MTLLRQRLPVGALQGARGANDHVLEEAEMQLRVAKTGTKLTMIAENDDPTTHGAAMIPFGDALKESDAVQIEPEDGAAVAAGGVAAHGDEAIPIAGSA